MRPTENTTPKIMLAVNDDKKICISKGKTGTTSLQNH